MQKGYIYEEEHAKLTELFQGVEETRAKLVEGLIEDAAFLKAENYALKETLKDTGLVLIHQSKPQLQRPVEGAKQYLKNVNSYAVIIKTLNGILSKNLIDEDDEELSDYV